MLSFMGAVLGLISGVWMESFVVAMVEVNQVMFGCIVYPESFIIMLVLTMILSGVMTAVMRRKLSYVDMAKSYKIK